MKPSLRSELPLTLLVLGMLAVTAFAWPIAPERMPVHWNLAGEVDRYGSRAEALLLAPGLALAVQVLTAFLPRIDPGRANYANFAGAWQVLRGLIVGFLAVLHLAMALPVFGVEIDVGRVVPAAVGVMFIGIGNVLGKLRPNWFAGVRTPWTLSSKRSWNQTHRLAGYLFVLHGIAVLIAAALSSEAAFGVLIGGVVLVTLVSVVYSWHVWRHDPDRIPPAGTLPADDGDYSSR